MILNRMGSLIIITTTTGLLIYYTYYRKNKNKIYFCDAQTQTQIEETTTPPNETNLPDFITVENTNVIDSNVIDSNVIDTTEVNTHPKRSLSLSSFFNYMRNN